MKLITFITIVCFLFVMVFLTASGVGSERGSHSNASLPLKYRVIN